MTCWEANSSSASQIHCILWNLKVHHCIHNSLYPKPDEFRWISKKCFIFEVSILQGCDTAHLRRMEISATQTQKPKNSLCFVLLLKSTFMLFMVFGGYFMFLLPIFLKSLNYTGILHWRWMLVLMTVVSVAFNCENRGCTICKIVISTKYK